MKVTTVHHANKPIAKIYIAENNKAKTKKEFIEYIVNSIPKDKHTGYAGFAEKAWLRRFLPPGIFAEYKGKTIPEYTLPQREINEIIATTLIKSYTTLPVSHTNVFVFPTFSNFVREKMNGSTGYTPHKNTLQLYVYPKQQSGWKQEIKHTIAHEYTHSAVLNHHNWQTLLDSIVYEGLAEHFREHVVGGKRAFWSKAISSAKAAKLWQKLRLHLQSKDYNLYHKVFFEDKEFPKWTGYTIGYEIVKSFLSNTKEKSWSNIIKNNSAQILAKSGYK